MAVKTWAVNGDESESERVEKKTFGKGGWLIGWLVDWLVDWLVGWLVGLVGWLVGWLGGFLFQQKSRPT